MTTLLAFGFLLSPLLVKVTPYERPVQQHTLTGFSYPILENKHTHAWHIETVLPHKKRCVNCGFVSFLK